MRPRFHLTVALCLGLALVAPPRAVAAPTDVLHHPSALKHFEKAQKRFDEEDYAGAIPELKAAYAIEPNPMLLYAWAQAERLDGDCQRAIELYERFLEKEPAQGQRQLAEANIADCEAELADRGEPTPAPTTDPLVDAEPTEDLEPSAPPDGEPPWHRDWVAGTLLGVGAASLIGGGVLLGVGKAEVDSSVDASSEEAYFDQADAGQAKFAAGAVLTSIGGALIVGGIVRLGILRARARKRASAGRAAVGVLYGPRGATLVLGGRF